MEQCSDNSRLLFAADYTLNPATTFTGAGTPQLQSGTLTVGANAIVTADNFLMSGGTLTGDVSSAAAPWDNVPRCFLPSSSTISSTRATPATWRILMARFRWRIPPAAMSCGCPRA